MNRILAILLCFCLSCQCVLKLSIFAWFEINQEYIAATLCENKDKPELVCCGKCVLSKKLAKADGNEKSNPKNQPGKVDKTEITAFVLPLHTGNISTILPQSVTPQIGYHKPIIPQAQISSVFHPPAV